MCVNCSPGFTVFVVSNVYTVESQKVNTLLLFISAQQAHLCVNCSPVFTVFVVSNVYTVKSGQKFTEG